MQFCIPGIKQKYLNNLKKRNSYLTWNAKQSFYGVIFLNTIDFAYFRKPMNILLLSLLLPCRIASGPQWSGPELRQSI